MLDGLVSTHWSAPNPDKLNQSMFVHLRSYDLDSEGVKAVDGGLDGLPVFPGHEVTVERGLHQLAEEPITQNLLSELHQLKQ
jgi:hypothetical protein